MARPKRRPWQLVALELGAVAVLCAAAYKLLPHAGVPHDTAIFAAGAAAARLVPYVIARKKRKRRPARRPAPRRRSS